MVEDESFGFSLLVLFYLLNRTKFAFYPQKGCYLIFLSILCLDDR